MEVQAEIHWVPTKNRPSLARPSRLMRSHDKSSANSVRLNMVNNRELLNSAEKIEILDDQGAIKPAIYKVRKFPFIFLQRVLAQSCGIQWKVMGNVDSGCTYQETTLFFERKILIDHLWPHAPFAAPRIIVVERRNE